MPDKAVFVDLDSPEAKQKISATCSKILDLLKQGCDGPMQAYAVILFVKDGFEQTYDIKGHMIYGKEDVGHA